MDPLIIQPGDLRHSIDIKSPVYAADVQGQSITPASWSTVRSTRAAIYTAGGKETSNALQIVSTCSHVVKVRWTAAVIKANYQVVFGVRTFNIQYVENVKERNRVLLIYCLEVNGGGQ